MRRKWMLLFLALSLFLTVAPLATVQAATTTKLFAAVRTAYGSGFPFSAADEIKVSKKNAFGVYGNVFGVSTKYMKSYKAYRKANDKGQYICFICKAKKKAYVKSIKNTLENYIANEKSTNENYYDAAGKELLSNVKIGSKKKFVYLFVMDTENNEKAVTAFKSGF